MTSNVTSGKIPETSLVHGSQATYSQSSPSARGTVVPPAGKNEPTTTTSTSSKAASAKTATAVSSATKAAVAKVTARQPTDLQAFADQLNKHLNDSGRADQFRLDNTGKLIQQVNPATGDVIGEFDVSEFPALARSVGGSGLLIDDVA